MDALNQIGQQRLVVEQGQVKPLTAPDNFVPQHALIKVWGAAVRWRSDGLEPKPDLGTFVPGGDLHSVVGDNVIDWTAPHTRYQSMIRRFRVVLAEGEVGPASIDIAYFD